MQENNMQKHVYRPQRVNIADSKPRVLRFLASLINGILAGVCFSLGAATYLTIDSKPLGAAIFSLGLFVIFYYGFGFYTSKIGYLFNQNKEQNSGILSIWVGNCLGAALTGVALSFLREAYATKLFERASKLSGTKLECSAANIIISAIFCGLLMFFAVDIFKNAKSGLQKCLIPLFAVMVFVLCDFEHFVSSTFYFVMSNTLSIKSGWYILLITLGNTIGAVIVPLCHKLIKVLRGC